MSDYVLVITEEEITKLESLLSRLSQKFADERVAFNLGMVKEMSPVDEVNWCEGARQKIGEIRQTRAMVIRDQSSVWIQMPIGVTVINPMTSVKELQRIMLETFQKMLRAMGYNVIANTLPYSGGRDRGIMA